MHDTPLTRLHHEIEARVHSIRENRPDWLCGKGCDHCCRHLAAQPQLTAAEWALLKEGLARLTLTHRQEIEQRMRALAERPSRPVVCPLLNSATGACPVYAERPVACRTYGFYVQRDLGLYCGDIERRVADGTLTDVIWGNQDAIERQLGGLGESRALSDWFAASQDIAI
jgi:Fe-S-cluster containining protein